MYRISYQARDTTKKGKGRRIIVRLTCAGYRTVRGKDHVQECPLPFSDYLMCDTGDDGPVFVLESSVLKIDTLTGKENDMANNGKTVKVTIPRGIEPVGIVEIADRLNVARDTVDKWLNRTKNGTVGFPESRWQVGGRPAWNWADIVKWCRATERVEGFLR
jgi:hypothetical protein